MTALASRLLAEIDNALRELDAITAPNDDVADRIGCAENAIRRTREAAAALSVPDGREAVAWMTPESITHLAKQNGVAKVDAWNTSDGNKRVPVFTTPQPGDGVVVPREPTEAMRRAGAARWAEGADNCMTVYDERELARGAWAAMIAAAPSAKGVAS